jgi:NADH:ubiquinone oxidoreductase subunit C
MKKIILFIALAVSTAAIAQKPTKGSFAGLQGVTEYNLVFDYENVKVDKFKTEEEFLKDKMSKREEKGTAEDFKATWFGDREAKYEPKFIECFNNAMKKKGVTLQKDLATAKYTMHVKTTWIYPGYNVGKFDQPAKLKVVISIFASSDPSTIIVSVPYEKVESTDMFGVEFNSGSRIASAYCALAKQHAKALSKGTK